MSVTFYATNHFWHHYPEKRAPPSEGPAFSITRTPYARLVFVVLAATALSNSMMKSESTFM